jgi:hypothetical protein
MKTAIFTGSIDPYCSGVSTAVLNFIEELAQKGHRFLIFCPALINPGRLRTVFLLQTLMPRSYFRNIMMASNIKTAVFVSINMLDPRWLTHNHTFDILSDVKRKFLSLRKDRKKGDKRM